MVTHDAGDAWQRGTAFYSGNEKVWLADEELPRVVFLATSAIAAGEEIRTDYGEAYWEGLPWGWVAIANALIALRLLAHHRSGKPD